MPKEIVLIIAWPVLIAIPIAACFYFIFAWQIGRALLAQWLYAWERKQDRAASIRDYLNEEGISEDTIDWITYKDKDGLRIRLITKFAALLASRIHNWKEWKDLVREEETYITNPMD